MTTTNAISARFDVPVEEVWAFVSWHGMPRLVEGGFFISADFPVGPEIRPGAMRRVSTADGTFVEQLLEYREAEHYYRYALVDTGPLPVTDYEGSVSVAGAGNGCLLTFGHKTSVVGTSEESWRELWLKIENQVIDFIRVRTSR